MADETNPDFKYIVRIANSDLDGKYQVVEALAMVKGLGIRTAAALCDRTGVTKVGRLGDLPDEEITKLASGVERITEVLPSWMLNRQKDADTGDDLHLHTSDLVQKHRDDINQLKKMQAYRGVRHATNQKVRGQRSRSNGRTGLTMGVIKKKEGK